MTAGRVLIVGGGPAGLATALGLARRGVPVTVLEREGGVARAPRAMTYHWSVLYGLDDLGVLEDMKAAGFTTGEINFHVWSTKENVTLSMAPLRGRVAHPYTLTLGQDRFAEVILQHLDREPGARVVWGAEVTEVSQTSTGVRADVVVDGTSEVFTAEWLVAADGAQSGVRSQMGVGFGGLTWPHKFIATNARFDFTTLGLRETNYLVDPAIGAVVAKVTPDGLWRVTWSEDAGLPVADLDHRVAAHYRALLPAGVEATVESRTLYRMHQRAVDSMRVGRVLFVGDAAHATNPTSGFGLVGGLYDSYILSEALGAIVNGGASAEILDRYSDDRLTAFWTVSSPASTESMRLVFHSDDPDRLEVDMNMFRRVAANPELLTAFWMRGKAIETPSVVTGQRISAGRNDLST